MHLRLGLLKLPAVAVSIGWLAGCVLVDREDIRHTVDGGTGTGDTGTPADTDTDTDTDTDADVDADTDVDTDTDTDTATTVPTGDTGPVEDPICPDPGKVAFKPTVINIPGDLGANDDFRIGGLISPVIPTPVFEIALKGDEVPVPTADDLLLLDVEPGNYFLVLCIDRTPSNFLCDGPEDTLISSGSDSLLTFSADTVLTVEVDVDAEVMRDIEFEPKSAACP